jgi:hypothetical protein
MAGCDAALIAGCDPMSVLVLPGPAPSASAAGVAPATLPHTVQ